LGEPVEDLSGDDESQTNFLLPESEFPSNSQSVRAAGQVRENEPPASAVRMGGSSETNRSGTPLPIVQQLSGGSSGNSSGQQGTVVKLESQSSLDLLRVQISGGSGDADLYVRFGEPPTLDEYDCRPYVGGNDETCEFPDPSVGDWYVMIYGFQSYSGVTLLAEEEQDGGSDPVIDVSPTELTASLAPGETSEQTLTVSNTGDSDLEFNVSIAGTGAPGMTAPSEVAASSDVQGSSNAAGGALATAGNGYDGAKSDVGQTSTTYQVDDGTSENGLGLINGGAFMWLNAYQVVEGAGTVTEISSAWGSGEGSGLPTDKPASFLIYEDPNDDGDPSDAVLLEQVTTEVQDPHTDEFTTESIPPTQVEGTFFVAALYEDQEASTYPAPMDESSEYQGVSWVVGSTTGEFDAEDLAANDVGPDNLGNIGFPANWLLRAEGGTGSTFVSVSPTSGTVPPDESQDLTAEFDAEGLEPGSTQEATINIGSNDEDQDPLPVPVTLDVTSDGDPQISVTSPSGGETWEIGTTHTIGWSSQDLQGSPVDIELRQDGSTVTTLASGIDGSQGSYEWTISEDRSGYTVFVEATEASASGESGSFELTSDGEPTECPLAWILDVEGTDAVDGAEIVTFGQSAAATAGIDPACGEEEQPPPPPSDVFDLRFTGTDLPGIEVGEGLIRDIRPTGQPTPEAAESAPATWRLEVQSSSFPVTFEWDNAALADSLPGVPVRLVDVVTGGGLVDVDMKSTGSYTLENSSVTALEIRLDRALTREVPIGAGWNLLSVPLETGDPSFGAVLPPCQSGFFFEPGSGYSSSIAEGDPVPVGRGLFANCSAGTAQVTGQAPDPTIEVAQGWNIIGPLADSVEVGSITSDPPGIVQTSFFGFDDGYQGAEALAPGGGYWVKVGESGTLDLSGSSGGQAALASESLASTQAAASGQKQLGAELHLTDAAGREATLRLAKDISEKTLQRASLPPVPPGQMFDVRFEGGRSLAETKGDDLRAIETQGFKAPVTVRLANAEEGQSVQVRHGGSETRLTAESPSAELTSTEDLSAGLQGAPEAFALKKTYPNPASGRATVEYALPEQSDVTIAVYDVLGRRVATLADGAKQAGRRTAVLDAGQMPSGTYFVRMRAEDFQQTRRLTVVR